jgi:hypothetical protein
VRLRQLCSRRHGQGRRSPRLATAADPRSAAVQEMKRALFMYAKLNPGLRYIQGMNELYAPLYYLFKTDADRTSARYAEADAFYCFVELISEFRDHFCQQLDNSQSGIRATIGRLMAVLQHHDAPLQNHLVHVNKVSAAAVGVMMCSYCVPGTPLLQPCCRRVPEALFSMVAKFYVM